jgi:hypothetical protein
MRPSNALVTVLSLPSNKSLVSPPESVSHFNKRLAEGVEVAPVGICRGSARPTAPYLRAEQNDGDLVDRIGSDDVEAGVGLAAFVIGGEELFLLDHDKRLNRKGAMLRTVDDLPDYGQVDCNHNKSCEQTDRQYQSVLFRIGQRDQGDHKRREDVAQGNRG